MGGGLDPGQIQRRHVGRVVEHAGQLTGEAIELLFAEMESGQAGDVGHVLTGEAVIAAHRCLSPLALSPPSALLPTSALLLP